jgi:hypothetical protein
MLTKYFPQCINLLGLLSSVTFSFPFLQYLYKLYFILVIDELGYASVFRNSIRSTDDNKEERILQTFAARCFIDSSPMSTTDMLIT